MYTTLFVMWLRLSAKVDDIFFHEAWDRVDGIAIAFAAIFGATQLGLASETILTVLGFVSIAYIATKGLFVVASLLIDLGRPQDLKG